MSADYNRKDRYYQKAKDEGFRSRAAYKIEQIHQKFQILKRGIKVVDLGCAPGSWLQVMSDKIGPEGRIVGLDLEAIPSLGKKNITLLQGDITDPAIVKNLLETVGGPVDLVVSDMAPHTTGIKFKDYYHSFELAQIALDVAKKALKPGGHFVVKFFPGEELENYKASLRKSFSEVKTFIPDATRKTSVELYLIGKGFKEL